MASHPRKRWKRPPPPAPADDPLAPMVKLLAQISFDEFLAEQAQPDDTRHDEDHQRIEQRRATR